MIDRCHAGHGYSLRSKERHFVLFINFMVKPNEQLVTVSLACYHTYTSVLSNW